MSDLRKRVQEIVDGLEDFARRDRENPRAQTRHSEWHTGLAVGYELAARWLRKALDEKGES